jgi:protein-S-isoprenylcysteine O-methyltransferase Ste14
MPVIFQVLAAAGFVALGLIIWRTMSANYYLSSRARIQSDRNQKVATAGPYQYVRHPMYIAIILLNPCLAFMLGSWWAIIPAALICPVYVMRTWLEDRMLQGELAGYRDYASRVRYRLVPGVW